MAESVDVNLLNPFIQAVLDCLTQMAGLDPKRKRVFVKQSPQMLGEVSGIIGLSNGVTGSCTVSFPTSLAEKVVASLLGESCEGDMAMVRDGIGEVANMVAGGAKRMFHDSDYNFQISTPTVIQSGEEPPSIYNPKDSVSICCEFVADDEVFFVEVAVRPE